MGCIDFAGFKLNINHKVRVGWNRWRIHFSKCIEIKMHSLKFISKCGSGKS